MNDSAGRSPDLRIAGAVCLPIPSPEQWLLSTDPPRLQWRGRAGFSPASQKTPGGIETSYRVYNKKRAEGDTARRRETPSGEQQSGGAGALREIRGVQARALPRNESDRVSTSDCDPAPDSGSGSTPVAGLFAGWDSDGGSGSYQSGWPRPWWPVYLPRAASTW